MRDRLADVFAKRDDPYAGADLALAGRFGGALWFLGAILTALLVPFVAADVAIGDAELDGEDGRPSALVDAADRALLLAKGSGAFDTPQPRG